MPNNDIFFICSEYWPEKIYIYGLKSSGEVYFNDNEENFREIDMNSVIDISYLNSVGLIINNKQYILICLTNNEYDYEPDKGVISHCQIIDYENKQIYNENLYILLDYDNRDDFNINSYFFTLLNLNQQNKILLSYLEDNSLDLSIINLSTENFSSYDIINNTKKKDDLLKPSLYSDLNCFITELKFIECIILHESENQLIVEIYDESLNNLDSIILSNVELFEDILSYANCIHLKNEIGVFAYYPFSISNIPCPLFVQINRLFFDGSHYIFQNVIKNENIFKITTSNNNDEDDHDFICMTTESLIKINDNKFSYSYIIDFNIIIIVIFDLYGTNKESLYIRYYKIDLSLYYFSDLYAIKLFKFNSFLGIEFVGALGDDIDSTRCSFSIFGYCSIKQSIELEIYKNNKGFILELNNYFSTIDNNLFGYELEIKISSIPNELFGLRFFSINESKEININEIINPNDKIIFDFSQVNFQIGEKYIVEISSIISTPEYNKFIQLYDKIDKYGDDIFENFYQRKIIEEKKFKVNLYISCHDQSIKTCNYPDLTTKIVKNNSIDYIYFSNFNQTDNLLNIYLNSNNLDDSDYCNNDIIDNNEYNYMNECVNECPSCYISDKYNCIFIFDYEYPLIYNSSYYDNCTEGKKEEDSENAIISKDDICPEDFPYLISLENICIKNCQIINFLNGDCKTNNPSENIKQDNINNIKNAIDEHTIDDILDNILTENSTDLIVIEKFIIYQLTSTENQNNNDYRNISTLKLKECENILKSKYNISQNESLLILKLDIYKEGLLTPIIEYEVYHPKTKIKLNLEY